MSCTQANFFLLKVELQVPYCPSRSSYAHTSYLNVSAISKGRSDERSGKLVYDPLRNRRAAGTVCMAKGDSKSGSEGFSWDSLKKAMGGVRQEPSVQNWIKEQMSKQEFDGNGGDGGRPGGGGGGDGSGGEEEGSFIGILDELLQVILATIGFVFVYIYLIRGAELSRLARDYIKYLFGSSPSVRLGKAMRKWRRFYQKLIVYEDVREDWLEREIVATPTWWHDPERLANLAEWMLRSKGKTDY